MWGREAAVDQNSRRAVLGIKRALGTARPVGRRHGTTQAPSWGYLLLSCPGRAVRQQLRLRRWPAGRAGKGAAPSLGHATYAPPGHGRKRPRRRTSRCPIASMRRFVDSTGTERGCHGVVFGVGVHGYAGDEGERCGGHRSTGIVSASTISRSEANLAQREACSANGGNRRDSRNCTGLPVDRLSEIGVRSDLDATLPLRPGEVIT